MRKLLAVLLATPLVLVACGTETIDENSTSSSFECCVNGSFYECPGMDALNACSTGDTFDCDRDTSRDSECE